MLNESLFYLSLNDLKVVVLQDLTVFDVALGYILLYVIYKALGRYIYFKPQEHASKVNRTFLLLSLLITLLSSLGVASGLLPASSESQWFYILCLLIILIAPLSIVADKIIWRYDSNGYGYISNDDYLPIERDYFKTAKSRSSQNGSVSDHWEEETVKSTGKNIHSDTLMNVGAGVVFLFTITDWTLQNLSIFGWPSLLFSVIIFASITLLYVDRSIFAWIKYVSVKWGLYSIDKKMLNFLRLNR